MRLLSLFAVAMAGLIAVPALAQTPPPDGTPTRVRGTVEKLDDHNLTVKSRDGQSLSITLAPDVDIITLVKKSLADIKPGDFVASTGVKDKDGKIHAIEARIFPKATPDGGRQFAWDLMPDSVMTNATVGTVTKAAQGAPPPPLPVARPCSAASLLLWRSLTSHARASSASVPHLPDADQSALQPVAGHETSQVPTRSFRT